MKIGTNHESVFIPEIEKQRTNQVVEQTTRKTTVEDSVTISNEGREKLKEAADNSKSQDVDSDKKVSLKIMKIRNKVEAGFYDTDKIISAITEKLTNVIREE